MYIIVVSFCFCLHVLNQRNDESISDCLRDFWGDIFRVFACHLVDRDVQVSPLMFHLPRIRCLVPSTLYPLPCTCCLVPAILYLLPCTCYIVPSTLYPSSTLRAYYPVLSIFYLLPCTIYSIPTTLYPCTAD